MLPKNEAKTSCNTGHSSLFRDIACDTFLPKSVSVAGPLTLMHVQAVISLINMVSDESFDAVQREVNVLIDS